MLQNNFTVRIEDKPDIEEAVFNFRVARFGLGNNERIIFLRQLAQFFGLLTGNVDSTFARKLDVIEVEHLVVEPLQGSFGKSNQSDGEIKAGEPGGRFDEM